MAADFFSEANDEMILEILNAVDPEMRDILSLFSRVSTTELTEKLIGVGDMKFLMKTRTTIFRAAMDKVDLCLSQVAKARDDNLCYMHEDEVAMIEKAEQWLKRLAPTDMIQRKCKKKATGDIIDLMTFASGIEECFPVRMLRPTGFFNSTANPHESSIAEAIAYVQHIANLSQLSYAEDSNTPNGTYGVNYGECSDFSISEEMFGERSTNPDPDALSEACTQDSTSESEQILNQSSDTILDKEDMEIENDISRTTPIEPGLHTPTIARASELNNVDENIVTPVITQMSEAVVPLEIEGSTKVNQDPTFITGMEREGTSTSLLGHGIVEDSDVQNVVIMASVEPAHVDDRTTTNAHVQNIPTPVQSALIEPIASVWSLEDEHGNTQREGIGTHTLPIGRATEQGSRTGVGDVSYANLGASYATGGTAGRQKYASTSSTHPESISRESASSDPSRAIDKSQPPPFKITVKFGDFSAEIDIADYVAMAGMPDRGRSSSRRRNQPPAGANSECSGCEHRFNEQDRRLDDMHDAMVEHMRTMQVQFGDLVQEVRDGRNRECVPDPWQLNGMPADPMQAGRDQEPVNDNMLESFRPRTRSRAATYAGAACKPDKQQKSTAARKLQKQAPEGGMVNEKAPKPQRQKGKKSRADKPRDINQDGHRPAENPLRNWLSSASRDVDASKATPPGPVPVRENERSPSWADDPVSDYDEPDTSGSITPTQATQRGRGETSAAPVGSPVTEDDYSCNGDSDSDIPPSGKTTEPRILSLDNTASGGGDICHPSSSTYGGGGKQRPSSSAFGGGGDRLTGRQMNGGGDQPSSSTYGGGDKRQTRRLMNGGGEQPSSSTYGGGDERRTRRLMNGGGEQPSSSTFGGGDERQTRRQTNGGGDQPSSSANGGGDGGQTRRQENGGGDQPSRSTYGGGDKRQLGRPTNGGGDQPSSSANGGRRTDKTSDMRNGGAPSQQSSRGANGGEKSSAHGGARPKTRGKENVPSGNMNMNASNVKGNSKGGSARGAGKSNGSYASVAAKQRWETVQNKKRKFEKVSPKRAFPLKGIAATCNRDVYLQGLEVGEGDGEEDMIESVRSYCLERGITPVFIRIIPVKYDCTRVGCRLTVTEEDFERVIDEGLWPDYISVREWTQRPRDNRGNDRGGARPPSDNED